MKPTEIVPAERRERAESLFASGCNCAQSVALTFADLLPEEISEDTLARLASPFGGGIGRLREVCGAVSGMMMIVGFLYGIEAGESGEPKKELYAKVQTLAKEFEALHGSIICRELLGLKKEGADSPAPSPRTPEYHASRPCGKFCGDAAEILARFLNENPIPSKEKND